MPKLNKKELVKLCQERGLPIKGLTRQGLVDQLQAYDDENDRNEDGGDLNDGENDEDPIEVARDGMTSQTDTGNAETAILRLKLELAREEKEKARILKETLELEIEARGEGSARARFGALDRRSEEKSGRNFENYARRIPAMQESEDLLVYLLTFEKVARLNNVPRDVWANLLPSLLNTATRMHYTRLSYETCSDYDDTKNALMTACRLTPRAYLEKFKSARRTGKENYIDYLFRLRDMHSYYLQAANINDFDSLRDSNIYEKFRGSLPDDVRIFVDSKMPKNAAKAAEYANLCFECHRKPQMETPYKAGLRQTEMTEGTSLAPKPHQQHVVATSIAPTESAKKVSGTQSAKTSIAPRCYVCGSPHHKQSFHNVKKQANVLQTKTGDERYANNVKNIANYQTKFIIPCFVNQISIIGLRDTAAEISVIREELVRPDQFLPNSSIKVGGIFSEFKSLPMAEIEISSPVLHGTKSFLLKAAVIRQLPNEIDILIGNDLFSTHVEATDIISVNETMISRNGKQSSALLDGRGSDTANEDLAAEKPRVSGQTLITTRRSNYGSGPGKTGEANQISSAIGK